MHPHCLVRVQRRLSPGDGPALPAPSVTAAILRAKTAQNLQRVLTSVVLCEFGFGIGRHGAFSSPHLDVFWWSAWVVFR